MPVPIWISAYYIQTYFFSFSPLGLQFTFRDFSDFNMWFFSYRKRKMSLFLHHALLSRDDLFNMILDNNQLKVWQLKKRLRQSKS